MSAMSTLLSTAYLGNIQYYTKLISGEAEIDLWENYRKQSYRNRCDVLTPNGVCSLIVPVLHPSGQKIRTKEVRIDNSKKWRHQHWQTIVSAYGRAPFFDHYAGAFESMYATEYELLAEWNRDLLQLTLQLLHLDIPVVYTDAYREAVPEASDFRDALSPKPRWRRHDPAFRPAPYYQVFSDRMPFAENLSIIDLLFCEGPETEGLLRNSMR